MITRSSDDAGAPWSFGKRSRRKVRRHHVEDAIRAAGPGLSGIDRAILRVILSYSNEQGYAWPALATIVRASGFERKSVMRALARVKANGWLEAKHKGSKAGTTLYRITPPDDWPYELSPPEGPNGRSPRGTTKYQ